MLLIYLDELNIKKESDKNGNDELFARKYNECIERYTKNYNKFIEKLNDLNLLVRQDNCILSMIINETPQLMMEFTKNLSGKKDIVDYMYSDNSELIELLNNILSKSS